MDNMKKPLTKLALAIVITSCTYDQTSLVGAAKWVARNYPGVSDANIVCQQKTKTLEGFVLCDIDIHNHHLVLECPVRYRINLCAYENTDCRMSSNLIGM